AWRPLMDSGGSPCTTFLLVALKNEEFGPLGVAYKLVANRSSVRRAARASDCGSSRNASRSSLMTLSQLIEISAPYLPTEYSYPPSITARDWYGASSATGWSTALPPSRVNRRTVRDRKSTRLN